jgi:hypothetical protein
MTDRHGKKRQEEGFEPFDYSKVNFSKFQGGSKVPVKNHRFEEKPKVSWIVHNSSSDHVQFNIMLPSKQGSLITPTNRIL